MPLPLMPHLCFFFFYPKKQIFVLPCSLPYNPVGILLLLLRQVRHCPVWWEGQFLLWLLSLPIARVCMFRGLASRYRNTPGFLRPGTISHCTLLIMTIPSWSRCGWRSQSTREKVAALPSMGAGRLERQLLQMQTRVIAGQENSRFGGFGGFLLK